MTRAHQRDQIRSRRIPGAWVTRFNYQWANQLGIYRLTGTVKPTLAYASR